MNPDMHWLTRAVEGFVAFLPSLVAGLVVLLLGYIVARVLARVTRSLLHRAGFDRLAARMKLTSPQAPEMASRWAGTAVFAVVAVATLMQVSRIWGLTFVAAGFARLIAYVPHVLAAALILGVALLVGNWVRDRLLQSPVMDAARAGDRSDQLRVVPSAVRGGILVIATFMALRELQIAPQIVDLAFTLTLGAIAVAAALAFGLGGRDVAGKIAQSWYERRRATGTRSDYAGPTTRTITAPGPAMTRR
jgi:hypothetical protein